MGRLDLSLLGTPQVRHAGQPLAFPTRKVLALLIYLVVEGGLPSREKLTTLFWPESGEGQARASFRRALALLRQALSETAALPHLIVKGEALGFDFTSDFACDLHSFQMAVQVTKSTEQVPPGLIERLRSAATLYRGNFLDGFSLPDAPDFDDWVRFQRERWHHQMEELFDRLTQAQGEAGEVAGALETARRWRRHAPFNEQVYLRLMHLHFVAGDRSAALHVYADCQSMLATEFHAAPTPETEALARRIRSQAPPRPDSLPDPSGPHDLSSSLVEGPLVGRDAEYATLKKLYQTAPSQRIQMVVLIGEAGIGKTRLATEFLNWAAVQGADILHGRAFETGGRLPYQPLVEALRRRLEREHAPDDLLSAVWLAELSRLLPELRERYPDLPLPTSGLGEAEARLHLFEAVARLCQAFGEQAPLVLFLDDLQWADAASLDLLQYVGRRCSESGTAVLALLTLRSEGLTQSSAFSDWLSSLERDVKVARLLLGPLSAEASMRLVRSLGQRKQAQDTLQEPTAPALERFGQWLFAETGGHPFFFMETLKELLQQGLLTLYQTESGQWAINLDEAASRGGHGRTLLPSSVRELVHARLSRLSPEARELLAAGAVLGHGFTFERLCQVAEMPEREGLRALDEGQRDGLLLEASNEASLSSQQPYTFAHDKIREVVYTEIGEARRRVLHHRALEVLQRDAAPVTELAHHALMARLLEPAFGLSVAAGDEAMRLFASTEAHQHYTRALETLSHLPDTEDRRGLRVETILKLVRVSWIAESPEHLLRRLAEAESLARTFTGSRRRLLARVHYWIGFLSIVRHAMRQAFESFQQVLVEAQEVDDEELLTLTSVQIARVLTGQGQFGKIEALLAPVVPRLEQSTNWTDWIFATGFLGIALAARGDYTAGLSAGERALARARAMNSYDNIARSHFFLGLMYGMGGDIPHMLEKGSLVVEMAQQASDWVFPYLGYGLRGWAESRLGRHEEALESLARSQAFGKQLGERLLLVDWFAAAHAEAALAAGRMEDALSLAQVAVELARAVDSLYSEGLAQRVWGQVLADASPSRWEEAEAHLASSVQLLESGEALLEAARTQVVWGQVCRQRGDMEAACEHFGRAVVQLQDDGLAHERALVLGYLAS